MLGRMFLAVMENGDVESLTPPINAHGEIGFHVIHGNTIFMKERTRNTLTDLFFGGIFQMSLAGYKVENVTLCDRGVVHVVRCIRWKQLLLNLGCCFRHRPLPRQTRFPYALPGALYPDYA
jgi:hypothetical protein